MESTKVKHDVMTTLISQRSAVFGCIVQLSQIKMPLSRNCQPGQNLSSTSDLRREKGNLNFSMSLSLFLVQTLKLNRIQILNANTS